MNRDEWEQEIDRYEREWEIERQEQYWEAINQGYVPMKKMLLNATPSTDGKQAEPDDWFNTWEYIQTL